MKHQISITEDDGCIIAVINVNVDPDDYDFMNMIEDALGDSGLVQCEECGEWLDGDIAVEDNMNFYCKECKSHASRI